MECQPKLIEQYMPFFTVFKACARYVLSNFIFSPNDSPSKTMKNVLFHLKSSFRSQDIQFFVIFSLLFYTFHYQNDK